MKNKYRDVEVMLADESFVRWIEGRASRSESIKWEAWMREDPMHKDLVDEAVRLHNNFRFRRYRYPEIADELQRLNQSIDRLEEIEGSYKFQRSNSHFSRNRFLLFAAVASLLVVAVVGGIYFSYSETRSVGTHDSAFVTKSTSFGQKKRLTLSDGSTVLLNSNSRLTFPQAHTGSYELWLQGEAYFNIVHNPQARERSVIVHTTDGQIEVVGTEFNVNTFNGETEVILKKGSVMVEVKDKIRGNHSLGQLMKPGQRGQFSAYKGKAHIESVNTVIYTAWTHNKLIFDHTSVSDIAKRLENMYGTEVIIDASVKDIKITGSVPNHNLSVLLNGLEKILQKPVNHTKNTIRIG